MPQPMITAAEAHVAYAFLLSKYIEQNPYRGGQERESDAVMAGRGGFAAALVELAMVAFDVDKEEAEARFAEDYADYAGSLG